MQRALKDRGFPGIKLRSFIGEHVENRLPSPVKVMRLMTMTSGRRKVPQGAVTTWCGVQLQARSVGGGLGMLPPSALSQPRKTLVSFT